MIKRFPMTLLALLALAFTPELALASDVTHSTVGAGGYDLVSYHVGEKPVRGNGNHLVVHEGVTYLFQGEDSKARFEKDPERYLPAYGGYCAYGVSVGKKFHGDPDVWEIVDGRLFLNLDNKIKGLWVKDIPGHVKKADQQWRRIAEVPAARL
ncbi:MAG: YHS domain-containing (seleno)protein [Myxococcota bacterium]|nr:YHS domain-containing (seleno)protein [Myxococcota bacterium]